MPNERNYFFGFNAESMLSGEHVGVELFQGFADASDYLYSIYG